MSEKPHISIKHRLPGRIRLLLEPFPNDVLKLEQDLRNHAGIEYFAASRHSQTVLVAFDEEEIAEAEVVIRIALSLSVEMDLTKIRVQRSTEAGRLDLMAGASGLTLLVTGFLRLLPSMVGRRALLDTMTAGVAGAAILLHAIEELQEEGTFHPETLSVIYLITSLMQGNGYTGAVLSWFASFGRHFKGRFIEELIIHIQPENNGFLGKRKYNISMAPGTRKLAQNNLMQYVPALIAHAIAGGKPDEQHLLSDVRQVGEEHGNMLEGLEGIKNGIAIQIRSK
jgi:hypothetical protein